MNNLLTLVLGLVLRIGIPVAVTVLVFYLLRRLDERWQRESKVTPAAFTGKKRCWEIKGCPPDRRKKCPAAAQSKTPCWQVFRSKEGILRESCLGCSIFHQSPVPL